MARYENIYIEFLCTLCDSQRVHFYLIGQVKSNDFWIVEFSIGSVNGFVMR